MIQPGKHGDHYPEVSNEIVKEYDVKKEKYWVFIFICLLIIYVMCISFLFGA